MPPMELPDPDVRHDTAAEPAALLSAYLGSGRQEAAFVRLVDRLGGLVFTSALRRTGSRTLAEEVTQTVFAMLAKKAAALRSHPNLSAWVFRTTQLESAKAMRTETRHQRKIASFARETDAHQEASDEPLAAWQAALPELDASLDQLAEKDRTLVIQRFFEGKRFAEIANTTGKSEAACKMQLKRALEKLASLLRSRGVALSVPVIATGLSAEFAKAAPLASQSLAAKSLAASTGISTATVLTNSLLTMSTAKSSALTAAAVVALSLFPLIHQHSEASRLRSEINTLEKTAALEIPSRSSTRTTATNIRSTRTLGEQLQINAQPVEVGPLLDDLMKVMMEQDLAGLIRVLTPVARMTPNEYTKLMEDLEAHDASPEAKSTALTILTSFAPPSDLRERLERLLRQGATPEMLCEPLHLWTSTDPEAALAWFHTAQADGKLLGIGVNPDPAPAMFAEILVALAQTQPERAIALAASMTRDDRQKFRVDTKLAAAFAQASIRSADTPHLDQASAIQSGHLAGLKKAESIADPDLKLATRRAIAESWLTLSPATAREHLPADLLPQEER
jgi:RNA polymerase sigma factor (sigma-70 family)